MIVSEAMDRIYRHLDEPRQGPRYYTQKAVLEALNKAQRLFALLTLCIERTTTLAITSGTPFYTLSSDTDFATYLCPLRVTHSNVRVRPATINDLDALNQSWRAATGTPIRYTAMGLDLFGVFPTATGSLSITFAAGPNELDDDEDSLEVPEQYALSLIDFAYFWCRVFEGGQEFQSTLPHLNRFLTDAQGCAQLIRNRSKAQGYDKMPLDLTLTDMGRVATAAMKLRNPRTASANGYVPS